MSVVLTFKDTSMDYFRAVVPNAMLKYLSPYISQKEVLFSEEEILSNVECIEIDDIKDLIYDLECLLFDTASPKAKYKFGNDLTLGFIINLYNASIEALEKVTEEQQNLLIVTH